jgi:dihydrofolate reductase
MNAPSSRITVHMAMSLDGYIARRDGSVDWMEVKDEFPAGASLSTDEIAAFLQGIDCYVMGSRTYETALGFESLGYGWAYGDKPVFVLTTRALSRTRETVEFHAGDLAQLLAEQLRPRFGHIWVAGGGMVAGECLRRGLADEVSCSVLPVALGDGIPFFAGLDRAAPLHLVEVKPYKSGTVLLRYEVSAAPVAA